MHPALIFIIGLSFLLLGSKGIIKYSLELAGKLKLSPLIVGILIVGIGTSLPEITVSILSGIEKTNELAIGNILGSNLSNISLLLGIAFLINNIRIGTTKTPKNSLIYLFSFILFTFILISNSLTLISGLLLISLGMITIFWEIKEGHKGALHEDKDTITNMAISSKKIPIIIILFLISLFLLVAGSQFIINSGIALAKMLGISSFVIGATAIAIGTSLPELAVTISASLAKEDKLIIGNILGSNIYNIFLSGGILGIFNTQIALDLFSVFTFSTVSLLLCLLIFLFRGKRIPRYFGLIFLLSYGLYLRFIFI